MSRRKRATVWVVVLSVFCGFIIWHVVHWHNMGSYLEMLNWTRTGRAYATVLYNLGLMVLSGVSLGLLMNEITTMLGYEIRHSDNNAQNAKTP